MDDEYLLIADDEPSIRMILSDLLEDEGYRVRTAADGRAALELCEWRLPQLLITDVNMPGMSGAELVAELQARQLGNFPVIVISGRHDLLEVSGRLNAIAEAKPIDLERFLDRVRVLLPAREPSPKSRRSV